MEKKDKPKNVPHGFDITTDPYVLLTPYKGGIADDETNIKQTVQQFLDNLTKVMDENNGKLSSVGDVLNNQYYGFLPDDTLKIYIPITESFKKNQESSFESYDPASVFQGMFGGPATMIGANLAQINGILGKMWSGSNIGIGSFTFSVAIDFTDTDKNVISSALKTNRDYMKILEKVAFPSRPSLGVFRPPRFCSMEVGVGGSKFFKRKYIGIRRCDIETLGMWQDISGEILPTAYNCTLEVEDMIVGRED